jgi:hypothetical protein
MTNLMMNKFCHPRVIHDKFGILGDKSCLSLKIICVCSDMILQQAYKYRPGDENFVSIQSKPSFFMANENYIFIILPPSLELRGNG